MLDENEICEEVQALLNRIEMFPEEFSEEVTENKWHKIINGLDDPSNLNPFTELERTLLRTKLRALTRTWMKRAILNEITNVEPEKDLLRDLTYNATLGRSKMRMGQSQTTVRKEEIKQLMEEEYRKLKSELAGRKLEELDQ
jgi:hypothetical protein